MAQSGFHCSLQCPPVTGTSVSVSSSSRKTIGARILLHLQDRHLEHAAGLGRDRQEGAIGLLALLAQARQHDLHDLVVVVEARRAAPRRSARSYTSRSSSRIRSRSRSRRGSGAASRCCDGRSSRTCRRDRECGSAAGPDAGAASPGSGMLSGTLRSPSMSSEKQKSRVGRSDRRLKAWRTMVVRTTSPKVPICGRPEGP